MLSNELMLVPLFTARLGSFHGISIGSSVVPVSARRFTPLTHPLRKRCQNSSSARSLSWRHQLLSIHAAGAESSLKEFQRLLMIFPDAENALSQSMEVAI